MTTISDPVEATSRRAGPRALATQYAIGRDKALYGGLLLLTAIAYLWGLSKNGYANEYYAAAVQAGSSSWKALFFGSFDSASFITVDKTPAALWVMGLSGRIFGFSSWSMLIPEALMGVASVGFVYVSVRRWFSANAGLLAGGILALTPVAVLMFRFNNPDALLILLLCAGAWAVTRAIDLVPAGRVAGLVVAGWVCHLGRTETVRRGRLGWQLDGVPAGSAGSSVVAGSVECRVS